jgi:serine/threonine-protein kinase
MPYIDGESLRARLQRERQLPVNEAIQIANEVADALQYAHAHGIIHRDIKPENILLQGGHALIADFGIALAASKSGAERMTATGMSLGTPQYMSPEQAMGDRELDARADVYALGAVLYEMLVGEPPFTGPTAQAVVAKVLTEAAPSARAKRANVPESVDDAIRVALEKTAADRFRMAAEFSAALSVPVATTRRVAAAPTPVASRHLLGFLAVAGVVLLALGAFGGTLFNRGGPLIVFGRASHVTWDPGLEITPALSPDGKFVAYAAGPLLNLHIMVRPVGEGRALRMTSDTLIAQTDPAWSADGSRILYMTASGVFSAPAGGGVARPEVPGDLNAPILSAVWSPSGSAIAFVRSDSLYVHESSSSTRAIAKVGTVSRCVWSPNGVFIACAAGNPFYSSPGSIFNNISPGWIVLCRVSDGSITTVTDSTSLHHSPAWSPDSKWLYMVSNRDGTNDVYAVPISGRGRASGPVERLTTGLGVHTISMSGNGTRLAYSRYSNRSSIWSLPIPTSPRTSSAAAVRLTNASETIETLTVSRDGKWLLFESDLPGNTDIFRIPSAGGEREQLTTDPADDFAPDLSPDGKEVVFHSWRSGSRDVYVARLDGGGVTAITHTPGQEAAGRWSPDGKTIAFTQFNGPPFGIWTTTRDAGGRWSQPRLIDRAGFYPIWSPDSKFIAFTTLAYSGDIRVIPADSGPARTIFPNSREISAPAWASDNRIYFSTHDDRGNASIWYLLPSGGAPVELIKFDPVLHPSYRTPIAVGNGKVYFTSEDRQSDLYVIEVRRP